MLFHLPRNRGDQIRWLLLMRGAGKGQSAGVEWCCGCEHGPGSTSISPEEILPVPATPSKHRINPVLLLFGPHPPAETDPVGAAPAVQLQPSPTSQISSSHCPQPRGSLIPALLGVLTHPRVKFPALSPQIPRSCRAADPGVPRKSGKYPAHFPSRK